MESPNLLNKLLFLFLFLSLCFPVENNIWVEPKYLDLIICMKVQLRVGPKLHIPGTLKIDLILWHTQLIVYAVKC